MKYMMTALVILLASAPSSVRLAGAQTNIAPQFEVASLKLSDGPGGLNLRPERSGGTIRWNAPLMIILSYAYRVPMWQISGVTGDALFYEIAAKTDPSATEDNIRLMLQALLADRLKLVSHRVTKESSGYALVVAKGGPKLTVANSRGEAPPMPQFPRRRLQQFPEGKLYTSDGSAWSLVVGRGVSISQLAEELSQRLEAFVVDRTGLREKYYFGFRSHWPNSPSESEEVASVFSVLPDELGLRLVKEKGPIELLVVDHFEKPVAN